MAGVDVGPLLSGDRADVTAAELAELVRLARIGAASEGLLRDLHEWHGNTGGWDAQCWRDLEAALGVDQPVEDEDW